MASNTPAEQLNRKSVKSEEDAGLKKRMELLQGMHLDVGDIGRPPEDYTFHNVEPPDKTDDDTRTEAQKIADRVAKKQNLQELDVRLKKQGVTKHPGDRHG